MTDRAAAGPALPSALDRRDEIARLLAGRRPVVFLDFDGTLSAIVEHPEEAAMLPAARAAVERLAARVPVIVVSGRGREDVARRVGLGDLIYAGSHGFDIAGPGIELRVAPEVPPLIEEVAARLEAELAAVPGAQVEPKGWTVAVHYRRVGPGDVAAVEAAVDRAVAERPELVKTGGKKVWEVRPAFPWDKGRAVLYLLEALGLGGEDVLPVYVGDDVTDEDAFRALRGRPGGGLTVRVGGEEGEAAETAAEYGLAGPEEVPELLERLAGVAGGGG